MYLGMGDIPEKWKKDYDCTTCAGSLVPGHIPPDKGFDQMYDITKKGGYLIFSVRDRYFESVGVKAKVE